MIARRRAADDKDARTGGAQARRDDSRRVSVAVDGEAAIEAYSHARYAAIVATRAASMFTLRLV